MGYTQRDVLQADVQKAYAESLGQMGANGGGGSVISNGNGGSGMGINANGLVNDMVNLGVGMAAAKTVMGPMGEMINGITNAAVGVTASAQPASSVNVTCPKCGSSVPANSKFCLECGNKIEMLANDEVICPVCGKKVKKGKFCLECGASLINKCSKCGAEVPLGGKFCPECGEKL
jgi:membrane protease subunit (stomatin/prohibitin family)